MGKPNNPYASVRYARLKLIAALIPFFILFLILMWIVGGRISKEDAKGTVTNPVQQNESQQKVDLIDETEFVNLDGASFSITPEGRLIVNGELKANGAFILSGSEQPKNPVAGQVFYNKDTQEVQFYNGTEFITLSNPKGEICFIGAANCDFLTAADLPSQVSIPLPVNVTDLAVNGVLLGQGTGKIIATSAPGAGQVLIGNAGGVPTFATISGALSVGSNGTASLNANSVGSAEISSSGVSAGTYGSALEVPVFTVDADGRITSVTNTSITASGVGDIINGGQAGPVVVGTNNATLLSLETNNVARLTIDATGQVAIMNLNCSANLNGGALTADASGNIICSDDNAGGGSITSLNGQTGSSQTFTNDANITITSAGDVHTLGWSGTLSVARGGTGASTAQGAINALSGLSTAGDILYFDGSNATRLPRGTANQCLISTVGTIQWGSCTAGGGAFTNLTLAGDSGVSQTLTDTNTITITGGTNVDTTASATDTLTIDVVANPTFAGLITANGGLTVQAGDTFTFNGEAFTDLSGTGLVFNAGALEAALGVSIVSSEITDGTILFADLAANGCANNDIIKFNGTVWYCGADTDTDTTLTEAQVEAFIFDGDNTGTLSSGTLALNSLSFTGTLNDANVNDALTISSAGSVADGALSANVSLLGQTIESSEITNGTILFADLAANGCSNGEVIEYNGSAWVCGVDTDTTGAFDISDGTNTQNISNGNTLTFAAGSGITVLVSATDTVTYSAVLGSTVDSSEIVDGTITGTDIAGGTITGSNIQDASILFADLAANGCANGNIVEYNGSAWICGTDDDTTYSAGTGISFAGTVISSTLGTSIDSSEIDADTITAGDIANDAVTNAEILNGTILFADLGQNGCANNEIIKWNGSAWICGTDATGGGAGNSFETIAVSNGTNTVADSSTDTLTLTDGVGITITGNGTTDTITIAAVLGNSIDSSEIVDGTITGTDIASGTVTSGNILDATLLFADLDDNGCLTDEIIKFNGTVWYCGTDTDTDTTLTEAQVEAFIFDADNTGTLSSGTLALNSLSFTGTLNDTNVNDALTISSAGSVADGALSANVSLLGQTIESSEITNGTILFADLGANGCSNGNVIKYNGASWVCGADADTTGAFDITDGTTTQNIANGDVMTFAAGAGITVLVSATDTVTYSAVLGSTVDSSEIIDGTITGTDIANGTITTGNILDATLTFADIDDNGCLTDEIIKFNGTVWYCGADTDTDTTLNEAQVEAFIFDGDNTGTLSSGTLALNSLSFTGTLNDANVNDALTISSSGSVADGALSANVSLLGQTIESSEITNGTILFADLAANGCANGEVIEYNGSAWICGVDTDTTGAFDISDGTNTQNISNGNTLTFAAGSGITVLVSATDTVTYSAVLGSTVDSSEIVDGTITGTDIASGTVTSTNIQDNTILFADIAANGCSNGQIFEYNGSAWICGTDDDTTYSAGTGISFAGTVISSTLGTSIDSSEIDADTITAGDIADDAVTTDEILDGTILFADLGQNGCANNEIIKWNGSAWFCGTDAAGGGAGNSFETISVSSGTNPVADSSVDTLTLTDGAGITITGNGTTDTITIAAVLGSTVDSSEIVDGTITGTDIASGTVTTGNILDATLLFADLDDNGCLTDEIIKFNGTVWYCGADTDTDTTLTEAQVEAFIFDGDNTGTLSSGTLALNSLSFTGTLNDANVNDALTISSAGSVADGALSANVSLLGQTIESSEITNGTILFADLAANGCSNGEVIEYNGSAWVCGVDTDTTGAFDISDGTNTQNISNGNTLTFAAGSGITVLVSATDTVTYSAVLGSTVDSSEIVDGTITGTDIASGTVTTGNILDATLLFADLDDNGCLTDEIIKFNGTVWYCGADTDTDTTLSEAQVEAFIFDGDNTGTLSSGTLALNSLSFTGTLNDANVNDALTISSAGSVADGALSANVSLLGQTIESSEITNGTILFADLAANGCSNGEVIEYNGSAWVCGVDTDTTGAFDISDGTNTQNISNGNTLTFAAGSGITVLVSATDTVTYSAVLGSTVDSSEIVDGTITGTDIASGTVTSTNIQDATILFADIAANGCSNGQIFEYNGSAWICGTDDDTTYSAGTGISFAGTVISSTLGTSIDSSEIDADTITAGDIATDAVTSTEILNGTILFADLGQNGCSNNDVIKWNGSAWICGTDAVGTAQNLFETFATPAGTSPVADGPTDTLTLADGAGITITGDGTTDTITIAAVLGATVDLGSEVTGTLPLGNGGTNATTAQGAINNISGLTTTGDLLYYNGTNATRLARGSSNQCLLSNGSTILWGSCTAGGGGFTNLVLTADSGTPETINDTDTINISGGSNLSSTVSATDTVTIDLVSNPTISGLVTLNGGLTVEAGDTFTFNGDAFTDLTGTGLTINAGVLETTLGTSIQDAEVDDSITIGAGGSVNDGALSANVSLLGSLIDLATEITGTLGIGNGGTGATTAQGAINNISGLTTEGDLLYRNATDTTRLARGSNGQCLTSNASTIVWTSCAGGGTTFFTLAGSTGTSQSINGGDTVTIAAGSSGNLTSVAGATDTVTVDIISNPTFSGLVTLNAGATIGAGQTLTINGDGFTDLTGTGLTISSGALQTTLGASIDTTEIVNATIAAVDLNTTNVAGAGTDDYILTYDNASGGFTWVDPTTVGASYSFNITDGTNSQTINNGNILNFTSGSNVSAVVSATDTLTIGVVTNPTFTGLITANGGLTVEAGDTFTFNSDAFTDLTGTGLTNNSGALEAVLGTSIDTSEITNGTILFADLGQNGCSNGDVIEWNGSAWICGTDDVGTAANTFGTIDTPNGTDPVADSSTDTLALADGAGITITGNGTTDTVTIAAVLGATVDLTSEVTGILPVANGGTNASSASGARTNLGAAASGANSDITSLTALTAITPSAALTVGATGQALTLQGSATSTITATDSGFTTTVGFVTPTANATISFPALAAGTYQVCTTSGNCLGGGSGGANTALSNLSSVAINTSLLTGNGSVDLGSDPAAFRNAFFTGTLSFEGSTADGNETSISVEDPTADVTYRFATTTAGTYDVCTTAGNCVGGGGGGAPNTAAYLTIGNDGTLTGERAIVAGSNLNATDGGANGNYTFDVINNPTFSGLITANGGLTVETGDTFTFNGDAFTDLTGTGLQISSGALQTTLGTSIQDAEVDDNITIGATGSVNDGALSANVSLLGSLIDLATEITGTLGIGNGGTGATTAQGAINNISGLTTNGDLLYYDGTNTTRLPRGTNNQCLTSNGTTVVWNSCTAGGGGFTNLTLAGSSGTPQTLTDTDTITIAAGSNITTTAGATDTVTIAVSNSPSFSGSVTAGTGLTVSAGGASITGNSSVTGTLSVSSTLTASNGLTVTTGGLTVSAGGLVIGADSAITDITGSGLAIASNALTVDATSATGFFRNGGNSFAGTATLGTNDSNSLVLETNGVSQATLAVGGALTLQNSANSNAGFQVRQQDASAVLTVDTTDEQVIIGDIATTTNTSSLVVDRTVAVLGGSLSTGVDFNLNNWTVGGASDYSRINLANYRGSIGSETDIQAGDILGAINGYGYDGDNTLGAAIQFVAAAEWGTGADISDAPTDIVFFTAPDTSQTEAERLRILSTGGVSVANALTVGNGLTVTAGGATITAGGLAVNGGDITTSQTSFNLLNATATTVNAFGAATTINIGAANGTAWFNSDELLVGNTGSSQLTGAGNAGFIVTSDDFGTASTNSGTIDFRSGNVSGATSTSGAVVLKSGNSTTSGNTGSLTISTGNATSGNSGNIAIDVGNGSGTDGTITLGSANASALTLGRAGLTTTNAGALTVTQIANFDDDITLDDGKDIILDSNSGGNGTISHSGTQLTVRNAEASGSLIVAADTFSVRASSAAGANHLNINSTGNVSFTPTTSGTATFTVNTASGGSGVVLRVDSTSETVEIPQGDLEVGRSGGSAQGAIRLWDADSGSPSTITITTPATGVSSYNFVLPAASGSNGDCLLNTSTPGTLTFGSCGSGFANTALSNLAAVNIGTTALNSTSNNLNLTTTTSGNIVLNSAATIELQDNTNVTGTLAATSTITGTTLNGTTGINTGAGAGTQRISNTGALQNIASLTGTGALAVNATSGNLTLGTTTSGNVVIDGAGVLTVTDNATFNGTLAATTDVDFTFAGTENLAVTSDLAGTVDGISFIGTPSASAGTTRGIFVQQANSANTNGLDSGIVVDNADTNLAIGSAIQILNSGATGGYTTLLDTPSLDISGTGAITGATGITSSGSITFSGLATCTGLTTNGSGLLACSTTAYASTLQNAYDNDTNGSDVLITLTSTDGALTVRDAASTIGSLFVVEANGGTNYLNVSSVLGTEISNSAFITAKGNATLSGTAAITNSTYTVTGTSTFFTTELHVGDYITINSQKRKVNTITNNTSLTVDAAWTSTVSGQTITRHPAALTVNDSSSNRVLLVQDDGRVNIGNVNSVDVTAKLTVQNTSNESAVRAIGYFDTTAGGTASTVDLIVNQTSSASAGFVGQLVNFDIWSSAVVDSSSVTGLAITGNNNATSDLSLLQGASIRTTAFGAGTTDFAIELGIDDGLFGANLNNSIGIGIADRTAGTNRTNLYIAQAGFGYYVPQSGIYSIYNGSVEDNVFVGDLRVGSTSAPTVALDVTGAASVSSNLTVNTDTLFANASNGRVGVGTASPDTNLHVNGNAENASLGAIMKLTGSATSTTNDQRGANLGILVAPSASSSRNYFGVDASATSSSANFSTSAVLGGITASGSYTGSATILSLTAGYFKNSLTSGTGSATNAYGLYVDDATDGSSGSITNNYGLYVAAQTAGTNDYNIYSAGAGSANLMQGTLRVEGTLSTVAVQPITANTYDLGSAALEYDDAYFGDDGIIYFGSAQDTRLTHSASNDRLELTGDGSNNQGSLFISNRFSLGYTGFTATDDGVANDTITPTGSFYLIDVNETANAGTPAIAISEASARTGDILILVNYEQDGTHFIVNITETGGTIELPANPVQLDNNDALMLVYTTDRWVAVSFSNNQ